MSAISCRLLYRSASLHIQQLYTGFCLLRATGFLRVAQQRRRTPVRYLNDAPHLIGADHAHLDAVLEGKLRVHFDTHDAQEIALGELETCDVYFKRSYLPAVVESLPVAQRSKVLPLGLNYCVLPDIPDPLRIQRGFGLSGLSRRTLGSIKQAFDTGNRFGFQPRQRLLEAPPDPAAPPNVLFLVAAYDPYDDPTRSEDKSAERASLNETRARCIKLLRDALGPRFTGGFSQSRFTERNYPDLVWPGSAAQESYLHVLKKFPICVASTGLHGSTGWKLAEYIAFSKAVVSEAPVYEVPGNFTSGRNFIEFSSPEECVHAAIRLIEDASLRRQIMQNNAAYYRDYLRPDVLVKNALLKALGTRTKQ